MTDAPDPATPSSPLRRKRTAFLDVVLWTACGLLVVWIAVGVLIPYRTCGLCTDPRDAALNQVLSFRGAGDLFQIEQGALAPTLDALAVPSPRSGEPFIDRIPLDPWGVAYSYRILDAEKRTYEIRSAGPDHRFGTDDDIVVPERGER